MTDKEINMNKEFNQSLAKMRNEIDKLRKINEAVARKLGWEEGPGNRWRRGDFSLPRYGVDDYCHSIEAAWEIIEWVKKQRFNVRKMFMAHLTVQSLVVEDVNIVHPFWWFLFFADQPMAICLAFLKLP